MKRFILIPLMAVAASASLALASPRRAEALPPIDFPYCSYIAYQLIEAERYQDWQSYDTWFDRAESAGCLAN